MSEAVGTIGRIVPGLQGRASSTPPDNKSGMDSSFTEVLDKMLNSVNNLQFDAAKAQELAAAGEIADVHDVMIALEKAGVAMDLLVEIRNKLVDAYETLVTMPM